MTMTHLTAVLVILTLLSGCGLHQEEIPQAGCELCIRIGVDHAVSFPPGRAELDASEREAIDDWIDTTRLRRDKSIGRISIETRAEWIRPGEVDLELAKRRAAAIRDFLVERGIAGDLIATSVLGPRVSFSEASADRSRCDSYAEIRRSWRG
jgi:outer membrane protein OmpA-like peptidoglycan-associated protein